MSALTSLKAASSLHQVAHILGYKPKAVSYLLYKMPPALRYTSFEIAKRSGGTRIISAPVAELKGLQRRLADVLQDCMAEINSAKPKRRPIAHGFRRGCSIMTNAVEHRRRRYVLNVDILDFFPTINFGRVRGFFIKNSEFALDPTVATVLAQIACHDGKLPQGSPCSPVISNLISHILDVRLAQLARRTGCMYTRYADDLTFSTNDAVFPPSVAQRSGSAHSWTAGATLQNIVNKCGFELNPAKTRMQYCDSRQEVTGLIVNRRANTRSEYRRAVRVMTHHLVQNGVFHVGEMKVDAAGKTSYVKINGRVPQLQGMFGFIEYVDRRTRELRGITDTRLSSIDKVYKRFLMHKDLWAASLPTILCEGKTDNVYLRGAIRRLVKAHPKLAELKADGTTGFKVRLLNYTYSMQRFLEISGGAHALKVFVSGYLKAVSKSAPPKDQMPLIIVLDNDKGGKDFYSLIRQYSTPKVMPSGLDDFYYLSANVYIVFTPIAPGGESKIEDFFDPTLLATKIEGKSFNAGNDGMDTDTEYGKWVFAQRVVKPHIGTIDFKLFTPLLARIEAVIEAQAKRSLTT